MSEGEPVAPAIAPEQIWWLYLLACTDGRTYAGIALDVVARFRMHVAGKGSKFTRANRPVRILGAQPFASRAQAQQAEHALKRLQRPEKLEWALRWPPPEQAD
ncbi:MAG TPA: GIY-YIG nuclease family protein [Steroidobacteraceae bacterium]|nr:GIY-YIG nuclease family protein [Steroidobacteraceae bacterium]